MQNRNREVTRVGDITSIHQLAGIRLEKLIKAIRKVQAALTKILGDGRNPLQPARKLSVIELQRIIAKLPSIAETSRSTRKLQQDVSFKARFLSGKSLEKIDVEGALGELRTSDMTQDRVAELADKWLEKYRLFVDFIDLIIFQVDKKEHPKHLERLLDTFRTQGTLREDLSIPEKRALTVRMGELEGNDTLFHPIKIMLELEEFITEKLEELIHD